MEEVVLERLGLNNKEVKIYLTLLKLGDSSVLEVSRKAKIGRTHTYEILDSLIAKGLVSFITENKTKKFKASNPEKILNQLKEKEAAFMEILPKLKKISELKEKNEPSVEVFRGMRGMKAMVNEIFEVKKDYCLLCTDHRNKNLEFYINHLVKLIEKENLHEKVLSKKSFSPVLSAKNSTARFLPEEYQYLTTTIIYGDRVGIIIWSEPFLAIRIKSKELAETYQNYFEIMWKVSKKG
jgi:HTH-type transcriptional regulator, sugar sensing transcriptional regulator